MGDHRRGPQLDAYYSSCDPKVLAIFFEHLQCADENQVTALVPRLKSKLRKYLREAQDKRGPAEKLLWDVTSPNKAVYTNGPSFRSAYREWVADEGGPAPTLSFLCVLKPSAFERVTLMGAGIEHSLVGQMLSRAGFQLVPHKRISQHLRYTEYPAEISQRLKIKYVLEGRSFSKTFRDRMGSTGKTVMEEIEDVVFAEVGSDRFLLTVNNDYAGRLASLPNHERLPVISHGLNDFSSHTKLVFLAALNRPPALKSC